MFLGAAYLSGNGIQKDPALAVKYLLQVAQQQSVDGGFQRSQALAEYWLAMLYGQGRGADRSHERAVEFLPLSATNGNPSAQYDLGVLYNEGTGGMEMDKVHACQLFEKAADQGSIVADHNAGYCHQVGIGGKKDLGKAIHYYQISADRGSAQSQHNLAIALGELGNAEKAYFWLRVAEASGYEEDKSLIEAAASRLTPPQLKQDDKDIEAWLSAHKAGPASLKP